MNTSPEDGQQAAHVQNNEQARDVQQALQLGQQLIPADLPYELVTRILTQAAQEIRDRYESPPWDDYTLKPYAWLKLLGVCHRWREIGINLHKLWDWIVPMSPECTAVFIGRSGNRPLTIPHRRLPALNPVHYSTEDDAAAPNHAVLDMQESLQTIYEQFYRIVRISLPSDTRVPRFGAEDAPMLQSLTLRDAQIVQTPMLKLLRTFPMSALTTLRSGWNPSSMNGLLRPTLTDVSLSGQFMRSGDDDHLLHVLQDLPALERFKFTHAEQLFHLGNLPIQVIPPTAWQLALPRMRRIDITDGGSGYAAAYMLRHLQLPEQVSIHIVGGSGRPHDIVTNAILQTTHDLGGPTVALAMAVTPHRQESPKCALRIWTHGAHIEEYAPFELWGEPRISYTVSVKDTTNPAFHPAFPFPVAAVPPPPVPADFGIAPLNHRVTTLYIDHDLPYRRWRTSFTGMGRLEQLYFAAPLLPTSSLKKVLVGDEHFARIKTLVLEGVDWCPLLELPQPLTPTELTKKVGEALTHCAKIETLVLLHATGLRAFDVNYLIKKGTLAHLVWNDVVVR